MFDIMSRLIQNACTNRECVCPFGHSKFYIQGSFQLESFVYRFAGNFFSCSSGLGAAISNGASNGDSSELHAAGFIPDQASYTVATQSTVFPSKQPVMKTPAPSDLSSRAIELHEGWSPILYT